MQNKTILPLSDDRKIHKSFTAMYIIALTILAVLIIISQIMIQKYLDHQIDDSHVINFAGRLRTYSQILSKTALLLESGRDVENNRKEFVNTLRQWQKSHEGLQNGSSFLNLPANDREEIKQMFGIIKTPHLEIWKASNKMLDVLYSGKPFNAESIRPYIQTILVYEKSYLLGMELIVFDYDRFSRERVHELKEIEYIILALFLLTLAGEAIIIFHPLSIRIKRIINGLIESQETSIKLAEQVQEAHRLTEKSHNELREITFALEKATYLVKTDHEGTIIYANDKYCHVTRYSLSELLGKPLFYNNTGGKESVIYEHIRHPIRKQEVWQGEIFDHACDGTGFWLDVTLMPVFDHAGNLYQYMAIGNDITRRKNTEMQIQLLTEEKIRRQDQEQKIRSYSIINGQEKERKRVAAEIHDGVGQMLTSLRMKLEQIYDRTQPQDADLYRANDMLYSIINETKRICSDLLPSVLDDFGLRSAINELVKTCRDSSKNIEFHLEESFSNVPMAKEVEIGIFRILQEALNNAIKHSGASKIDIYADSNPEFLNLMVQDNGKGFYFDSKSLFTGLVKKANGLRNMNERAQLIGGSLNINTQPGLGTTIQLEVSL